MRASRALTCAALLVAVAGAGLGESGSRTAGARPEESPAPGGARWRERRPAASLLLVGNQRGLLLPCRGTRPPLGGVARLAALADLLAPRLASPADFSGVSLGRTMAGRLEEQEESKAVLYRAVLQETGFGALLLASSDLLVPAMCRPFPGGGPLDEPRPPPNVHLAPGSPARDTQPFVDLEVGGVRFRAGTFVDPEEGARLVADGLAEHFSSTPSVLEGMQPRPDVVWLVGAHLSGVELEALRAGLPRLGAAVVVDLTRSSGAEVVEGARLEARTGQPPLVVTFDELGKAAGVLDLEPLAGAEGWSVSFHSVPLDPGLEEVPSPRRDRVTSDLLERYRLEVKERGYLERFETIPFAGGGLQYLGSGACARCHPGIYEDWVNSRHAVALRTLARSGHEWDPECVRCHVVGFERFPDGRWRRVTSGFRHPQRTQHLGGVGCESCHGPGSAHVAAPNDAGTWAPGRPNRRDPGLEGCLHCHDAENSHGFAETFSTQHRARVDHRQVPRDRRTLHVTGGGSGGR